MPVTVRPADPSVIADAGALASLRRAWTEEVVSSAIDDPTFEGRMAAWLAAEAGHRRSFVAAADSTPVGMVSLVLMRRMPRPGRPESSWGYVHQFFVLPDHRDRGVGAALMDAIVEAAVSDGLSQLVLNPTPPSVRFYERHGFRPAEHLLIRLLTE